MANTITYQFAVRKCEIAAYSVGVAASWVTIPTVAESTVNYTLTDAQVADAEGNLLLIWKHTQRAKVTLRMKPYAFRVLEILSGSPVSSAQGSDMLYFGRAEEVSPPFVRLRFQQKSVDSNGNAGFFKVVLFKCQGALPPMTMREVSPSDYTVSFDALAITDDDTGATIPQSLGKVTALATTIS